LIFSRFFLTLYLFFLCEKRFLSFSENWKPLTCGALGSVVLRPVPGLLVGWRRPPGAELRPRPPCMCHAIKAPPRSGRGLKLPLTSRARPVRGSPPHCCLSATVGTRSEAAVALPLPTASVRNCHQKLPRHRAASAVFHPSYHLLQHRIDVLLLADHLIGGPHLFSGLPSPFPRCSLAPPWNQPFRTPPATGAPTLSENAAAVPVFHLPVGKKLW
jgi:hypothetical protein